MPYRFSQRVLLLAPLLIITFLEGCDTRRASADADKETATSTETSPDKAPTSTTQVVIDHFAYTPATLTVSAGTKVTWVNRDDVPHTVTSSKKPHILDSPPLDTDEQFSFEFKTPGTYDYYCTLHPKMKAQIIVK
jgi:plastocyanin